MLEYPSHSTSRLGCDPGNWPAVLGGNTQTFGIVSSGCGDSYTHRHKFLPISIGPILFAAGERQMRRSTDLCSLLPTQC